jgi:hypothetical protein
MSSSNSIPPSFSFRSLERLKEEKSVMEKKYSELPDEYSKLYRLRQVERLAEYASGGESETFLDEFLRRNTIGKRVLETQRNEWKSLNFSSIFIFF